MVSRRDFVRGSLVSLGALAGLGAAGGCGGPSSSSALKFSHVQSSTHFTSVAVEWLSGQLADKSDRSVTLYASGSLGGPDETVLGLQSGDVDLTWISTGQLARGVPELNLVSCAYLIESRKHFRRIATPGSRVFDRLKELVEGSISGVRMLAVMGGPARNLYTNGKPVKTPEDLDGRQIRVEDSPVKAEEWGIFGADPVPLSWSEIYTALQSGVIAGAESSTDAYDTNKFGEVAPNLSLTEHEYSLLPVLMSESRFQGLDADTQSLLTDLVQQAAQRSWEEGWSRVDALEGGDLAEQGINVVRADRAAFASLVKSSPERIAERYDATDLLDEIRQEAAS